MMKLKLSPRRIYKEATKSRVPNDEVEVITSKDLRSQSLRNVCVTYDHLYTGFPFFVIKSCSPRVHDISPFRNMSITTDITS